MPIYMNVFWKVSIPLVNASILQTPSYKLVSIIDSKQQKIKDNMNMRAT